MICCTLFAYNNISSSLHSVSYETADKETIQRLIADGANINEMRLRTLDNYLYRSITPLAIAAGHGNIEAMEVLLANGAYAGPIGKRGGIPHVTYYSISPLTEAMRCQKKEAVKLLIATGAVTKDPYALCNVVQFAKADDIEALIAAGANVNEVNYINGWGDRTALGLAARYGNVEAVKVLLAHNADVHLMPSNMNPLDDAYKYGHRQVVEILRAHTEC